MIRVGCALLALCALLLPQPAQAQSWPSRFVRIVVPGGSGTAADVSARIVAQALSELWNQQVVVENKPGAGGVVGTVHAIQSPPDGYTLLYAQGAPLSLTPYAFKSVPYDVERDLEPIMFVGYGPLLLASSMKLPVKSVADVIDLARKNPGKLSFATASSPQHSASGRRVFLEGGRRPDGERALQRLSTCGAGYRRRRGRSHLRRRATHAAARPGTCAFSA